MEAMDGKFHGDWQCLSLYEESFQTLTSCYQSTIADLNEKLRLSLDMLNLICPTKS
jgi:hypothetical protein